MKKQSILLVFLFMGLAVTIFSSWLRCQESYHDEDGVWFLRYTQQDSLWKTVDSNVFLALNGTMRNSATMQTVWGIANHRAFDLAALFWMVLLFVIYYLRNPREEERISLVQFGLYMTIALLLVSGISELSIQFHRMSPGKIDELRRQAVVLSDLKERITWKVKVASNNSFPGDHATVLLFIGSYIIYRLRSWYGVVAAAGMVVFSLPRLVGGGHWFSDIMAGSLSCYLFFFPLTLFKPLRERVLVRLRKPAVRIYKVLNILNQDRTSKG